MNAIDFALLAQEAYGAKPDIGSASAASCAIVRDTAAGRVVAFRGTDDIAALLADFFIIPDVLPELGDVHRGFWNTWLSLESGVADAVADHPVTFTGHSLGAALAVLAGAVYAAGKRPVNAIYGFEPPRVSPQKKIGNLLSATSVLLYRNGNDVVTQVPLMWPQPAPLIAIGEPTYPFLNIADHEIARVIAALRANGQTAAS